MGGAGGGVSSPGGAGIAELKKALRSLRKNPEALYKVLAALDPVITLKPRTRHFNPEPEP